MLIAINHGVHNNQRKTTTKGKPALTFSGIRFTPNRRMGNRVCMVDFKNSGLTSCTGNNATINDPAMQNYKKANVSLAKELLKGLSHWPLNLRTLTIFGIVGLPLSVSHEKVHSH